MRSVFRIWGGALMVAALAFLIAGCTTATPAAAPTSAPAATPAVTQAATPAAKVAPTSTTATQAEDKPISPAVTVKLGILPIFSAVNIYTAMEKGFFKDQGLNIDLTNFDTAAKMIAPLTTGDLEVGAGATSAGFYNALNRGLPIKVVADWNSAVSPSTLVLVARKDLVDSGKIKDYSDLKGKTVSINAPGVFSEIILDQALKKGGLTIKDVNQVIVPFDQVPIAMANKSVDVSLTNEPFVTIGVSQGVHVRWKDVAELDPGREYSVIFFSPVFAKDNAEAAKRWALAYVKGVRYYRKAILTKDGKAEMITILDKYAGAKPAGFYDQVVFPYSNPDGYVDQKSVLGDLDWYVANGQVKDKPDMKAVIDNTYMDYAIQKLGKFQ
ncbi:MAG: ABC transporter substrate-binding protein [Dehalococcoidia bacterium]|nr:ABC transporter substrate-binding protein [Dehalococcoidia bacterium]